MPYNTTVEEDKTIKLARNSSNVIEDLLTVIDRLDGEVEQLAVKLSNTETILEALRTTFKYARR